MILFNLEYNDILMRILAEIDRHPNAPHLGRTICREAVRGIVIKEGKLLLIHSRVNGDYKFPGGGVRQGEDHATALIREVAEESGARVVSVPQPFGKVIEYDHPCETDFDVFCMTSYYYCCGVDAVLGHQQLDEYEARLGFVPEWVDVETAIRKNKLILTSGKKVERWVKRETRVLQIIRDELIG